MARKPIENETHFGHELIHELADNDLVKSIFGIKHPATTTEFTQPQFSKEIEGDLPLITVGLDIETQKNGDLKLLGLFDGSYKKIYKDGKSIDSKKVLSWLATEVESLTWKNTKTQGACLVCWSELDGSVILREFFNALSYTAEQQSAVNKAWGNIEAMYDKSIGWIVPPLVSIKLEIQSKANTNPFDPREYVGREVEFGIWQVIKGSVCFYIKDDEKNRLKKVWMYDMGGIYASNLETVASDLGLDYEKGAKELHEVDWTRFDDSKEFTYHMEVIKSNQRDAKAVKEIADGTSENYSETFKKMVKDENGKWVSLKKYPKSFFSTGTMTSFGLSLMMKYEDRLSVNWAKQLEDWIEVGGHEQDMMIDFECACSEGYRAGLIEAFMLGRAGKNEKVFMSDFTGAYPFMMKNLFDLRGSKITYHKASETNPKPKAPNSTTYILGRVDFKDVDVYSYHTVGVKEPRFEEGTIRPGGNFSATVLYHEAELIEKHCEGEAVWVDWYEIETTGEIHPFAKVITKLWNKRNKLIKEAKKAVEFGDEELAGKLKRQGDALKIVMNGIYGKLFEGTRKFVFDGKEDKFFFKGYKSGQLYNPLLAAIVCGFTRIRLVEAMNEITKNGGKVVMALTDAIYWVGKGKELPKSFPSCLGDYTLDLRTIETTEEKQLGAFDGVHECKDFLCLGAGRYEYKDKDNKLIIKNRGYMINILGFQQEATSENRETPIVETLSMMMNDAIKNRYKVAMKEGLSQSEKDLFMMMVGTPCLKAKQRILCTPGYCSAQMNPSLLGQIIEVDVDMIITRIFPKRVANEHELKLDILNKRMIETWSPTKELFPQTVFLPLDGTLKVLREKVKEMETIAFATKEIREDRKKKKETESEAKRYQEKKKLMEFFGMKKDGFQKWVSSVKDLGGINYVRQLAKEQGFKE